MFSVIVYNGVKLTKDSFDLSCSKTNGPAHSVRKACSQRFIEILPSNRKHTKWILYNTRMHRTSDEKIIHITFRRRGDIVVLHQASLTKY